MNELKPKVTKLIELISIIYDNGIVQHTYIRNNQYCRLMACTIGFMKYMPAVLTIVAVM